MCRHGKRASLDVLRYNKFSGLISVDFAVFLGWVRIMDMIHCRLHNHIFLFEEDSVVVVGGTGDCWMPLDQVWH